jgi:N-(2-amino-2-carboxyethyl)-L-glutamate synthase
MKRFAVACAGGVRGRAEAGMNVNVMNADGVLSAVGRTPLVRLARLLPGAEFSVYGKLEALNPGGSMKDRPAALMIRRALERSVIDRETVVVESSSGNMGIGLAQACAYHGLRFICVTDSKTTAQNIAILKAYGAHVECVTEPDPETGELLTARLKRVAQLLGSIENSWWPNQYASRDNSDAHYHSTMFEIAEDLDGRVDYLFIATSTCGTIRGCLEFIKSHGLGTQVVAVDAIGSLIFSNTAAKRMIPGLGVGMRPDLCPIDLVERCIHVSDVDCIAGCWRLVRTEAIFAGGSSGGVVSALARMRGEIPRGATCVVLLADRGERYLDTIYSERWIAEHFGDVTEAWKHGFDVRTRVEAASV